MFSYKPDCLIASVTIFGLGGTGARLASLICQQLISENYSKAIKVILVDGDTVEAKNCKRQLFIESDVGKNKAEVIANRYRKAFGSNVISVPYFMPNDVDTTAFFREGDNQVTPAITSLLSALASKDWPQVQMQRERNEHYVTGLYEGLSKGLNVFVLAVDSVPARQGILALLQYLSLQPTIQVGVGSLPTNKLSTLAGNILVIDGGNEDTFGQVNYFHPVQYSLSPVSLSVIPDRLPYRYPLAAVPMPTGKYLHMVEGTSTRRCGEMEQTMAINNLVASNMHLIFQNLFYNLEMTFHKIKFDLSGSYQTSWMDLKWMKGVLTDDKNYAYGTLQPDNKEAPQNNLRFGRFPKFRNVINALETGIGGMAVGHKQGSSYSDCVGHSFLDTAEYHHSPTYGEFLPRCLPSDYSGWGKGLTLFLNTSLLDICWSEIVHPVLLHLYTQKWISTKEVQDFLGCLYDVNARGLDGTIQWKALTQLHNQEDDSSRLASPMEKETYNYREAIPIHTMGYSCLMLNRNGSEIIADPFSEKPLLRYKSVADGEIPLLVISNSDNLPLLGLSTTLKSRKNTGFVLHVSSGMTCLGALALESGFSKGIPSDIQNLDFLVSSNSLYANNYGYLTHVSANSYNGALLFKEMDSMYLSLTLFGEIVLDCNDRFLRLLRTYTGASEYDIEDLLSRYCDKERFLEIFPDHSDEEDEPEEDFEPYDDDY